MLSFHDDPEYLSNVPKWLASLEYKIFNGLPKEDAILWRENFLNSIGPGIDVEKIKHQLAIKRMDRLLLLQKENTNKHIEKINTLFLNNIKVLEEAKKVHEAEIRNCCNDFPAWWTPNTGWYNIRLNCLSAAGAASTPMPQRSLIRLIAESAARSAAWSVWPITESAKESSDWCAASTAWSTIVIENLEESEAWPLALSEAWRQEANDLLECLRGLKNET